MQDSHGYRVSIFGALMLGILQGVSIVLSDTVKVLKAGSSLNMSFQYAMESGLTVQWSFNNNIFAEYSTEQNYTLLESHFRSRLKKDYDRVSVTVQDLQPQDSGTYSVSAFSIAGQKHPTQSFTVYIQSPITSVQIEKTQTWPVTTNSCDVNVTCAAPGSERVSYLWSGYKSANGSRLQFSFSPADGVITLNCTAANNVSSSSSTTTLSCEQTKTSAIPDYVWIAVAGGTSLFLLFSVIVAMTCWWRSRKNGTAHEGDHTVYADVNTGPTVLKDKRSDSVVNGMTVYETVDDLRVTPEMTIYAKVTLPQHAKVSTSTSSPYQQVL